MGLLVACAPAAEDTAPPPSSGAEGLRGDRYCEVILVTSAATGLVASVYNSYPMNDCPQEAWAQLDSKVLAAENGALAAVLNGPRYWLMDRIDKVLDTSGPTKFFGGIEMTQRATLSITDPATEQAPYQLHRVDRKTSFTFDAGSRIYELHPADGATFVMQSWSQQIEPSLVESDLPNLAPRLELPAGWSFSSRVLDTPLTVDTTSAPAEVTTDALMNTYSRQPD